MPDLSDLLAPLVPAGQPLSTSFAVLLLIHIPAGLIGVIAGAVAALSPKRPGRHPRFGTVYYGSLAVVFVTAVGMGLLRWAEDRHLVVLGSISFGVASLGYAARKIRWRGWVGIHVTAMGVSYIVLLTAFYVDNGSRLPVWDRLPAITYWTLPTLVGGPLILRALCRYTQVNARLGTACRRAGGAPRPEGCVPDRSPPDI